MDGWMDGWMDVLAVVGMGAEVSGASVEDVSHCEGRIVAQWNAISAGEKSQLRERMDEILRPLGLQTRLMVVERANSIELYFVCMTRSVVMSLRDQFNGGKLKDIVQLLFTFLSGTTVILKRLSWILRDYEKCLEFFDVKGMQTLIHYVNCHQHS